MEPVVERLLGSKEPSVRWKVRTGVLGESPTSRPLRALQREIRESPRVRKLLAGRDAAGRLAPVKNVYSKWKGAHWVLASLADLGYPPGDRELVPLRDQVLARWLAPHFYQEFAAEKKSQVYGKRGVPVVQGRPRRCASQQGNALWSVLTLGLADERVSDLVERLLHWQWPDGGWNCDKKPDASHSSFMESILPLRGLALAARETGDAKAGAAARRASEIFLKRHLFKRQRDGKLIRREFAKLHYPLYWHYDVLHGLKVLAEAGRLDDPRCKDALDLLESKRLPDGGWPAEERYYQAKAERVDWGGTSGTRLNEWVSADALAVLRAAGRLDA